MTLIVGVYVKGGYSSMIGSFLDGERGVLLEIGQGCIGLLIKALKAAPLSTELCIYTNYQDLVDVYHRPLALPELRVEKYSFVDKGGKTQWRTRQVPEGNQAQWELLRAMSRYYKWSMQLIDDLPACREWWELNYG